MRRALLFLAVLTACSTIEETDTVPDDVAPWQGAWSGYVAGHAAFNPDWEVAPYCAGELGLVVQGETVTGTGQCAILWGPYVGELFEVQTSGTLTEPGAFSLELTFAYPDEVRDFDDVTLSGTAGAKIEALAPSTYRSTAGGGVEQEAEVRITLVPGDTPNQDDDPSDDGGDPSDTGEV